MNTHTMDMSIFDIMGLLGVVFYLGSYAALQFEIIDGRKVVYPLLNFLAASFVLVSLFENFNLPSLLIQISWIAISLYGISRLTMISNGEKRKVYQPTSAELGGHPCPSAATQ